ncbi:MAG: mucoidy inhibitor MuiA family protein, partial [Crocinitomicaceae bacterium]|nr:mucoidy inhibitor MuiA family protein [Crocinitomicaceae bacterium]
KPVINYTEIVVEIDVEKETDASFFFNYISPKASWKPYYDMRSDGIGKPIKLEAKALVSQNTGIEWINVDMVLSTNDPYENSKEPIIAPWYINYNNYPQQKYQTQRNLPTVDYSGEKIQGEVIDANTGEPMPFTKISFPSNPSIGVITDVDGKFAVSVPRNERQIIASFVGYQSSTLSIDAPYLKFFMVANEVELEEVVVLQDKGSYGQTVTRQDISRLPVRSADGYVSSVRKRNYKAKNKAYASAYDEVSKSEVRKAQYVQTQVVKKDLRMEYQIQSKMSIPTDGMDHRVQIANFDLDASYEYHTAPKIDPAVFLAAQVTGWEKLNLLSGESNIYFDGTYIGKSYIDVNSTKDTLSFSFGKDSKVIVERTKVKDKSSNKVLGSRQKYEVTWEIRMRNNGGASIPIIVKDQFPISTNNDIKVRNGEFGTAQLTEKTGILVWKLNLPLGGSQNLQFGYTVDYQKGYTLYLE